MSPQSPVRYSLLDLAPIIPGSTAAVSFRNSVDLAQHAERLGYHRFWLAEHHNIAGIASAATSVVIGHVAGATSHIRVGAGGIMLPNHAPLVIAEQFGTLESMYSGRIDLGLGRAPGGDGRTARALRRNLGSSGDTFPQDLAELRSYFRPAEPGQAVRAVPGEGLNVPIYLLGSSDFSARLAAIEGLPFAFASHFAPDYLAIALDLYRGNFRPSDQLDRPHAMVGVNVFAADTDREAVRLFTTLQQTFLSLVRGMPRGLAAPVDSMEGRWHPEEAAHVHRMTRYSVVGSPQSVRQQLQQVLDDTTADELVLTAQIYDHDARKRSFEIAAGAFDEINRERASSELQTAGG
ncbi:MAG TPA: LLM class flavin-dependent oxidoreductase [Tepidisphaeraceae bacterium]|jgi:luciferase family oxidoreductase group 1|nr:LLM class flavin-dependent oxidoreductase [Tepidisphaeraceae bacterium]